MFESKGNASVSQEAWGRIADVTLGFLLNRRVPREDAENIAGEALCIALEKYDPQYWHQRGDASIDSEEAMRRLVVMVADHKTRAFWREKKRDQKYLLPLEQDEDLRDLTAPGTDIPDQILQEKQNGEWLEKHLQACRSKTGWCWICGVENTPTTISPAICGPRSRRSNRVSTRRGKNSEVRQV